MDEGTYKVNSSSIPQESAGKVTEGEPTVKIEYPGVKLSIVKKLVNKHI